MLFALEKRQEAEGTLSKDQAEKVRRSSVALKYLLNLQLVLVVETKSRRKTRSCEREYAKKCALLANATPKVVAKENAKNS
jgi:hypothetical protein